MRNRRDRDQSKKGPSATQWFQWLLNEDERAPPGRIPPRLIVELLDALPATLLPRAAQRVVGGFVQVAPKGKRQTVIPASWMPLVTGLSRRWIAKVHGESAEELPSLVTQAAIIFYLSKNSRNEPSQLLGALAAFIQLGAEPANGVAKALHCGLAAKDTQRGTHQLLRNLAAQLAPDVRLAFWQLMVEDCSRKGDLEKRGWLLDAIERKERARLFERLVLAAAQGTIPSRDVGKELLRQVGATVQTERLVFWFPMLCAAELLEDDSQELLATAAEMFTNAISSQAGKPEKSTLTKLAGVAIETAAVAREGLRKDYQEELRAGGRRTRNLEADLERANKELDVLRFEMARKREDARLDIRRDMLMAIGETLQLLHSKHSDPASVLSDVEAGLHLALEAGEAQPLGHAGEEVEYNPGLHKASDPLERGARVRITFPGIVVRGGSLGDNVLLKAVVQLKEAPR